MPDVSNPHDELLDRAVASLRDGPVPPGPAPLVRERTVRAIAAGGRARRRFNVFRAAAAILMLIGLISIAFQIARHHGTPVNGPPDVMAIKGDGSPVPHPAPRVVVTTGPSHDAPLPPSPRQPGPTIVASNVSVTGRVYYDGPRPARKQIDLTACPQCAVAADGPIYDESLVVNDNGSLQNVVVSVSGGLPPGAQFASAAGPVTLDQKGCTFRPHVLATRVGQPIVVKNSDPFLHSVHSLDAEDAPAFDFAQPTIGRRDVEPLRAVETFQVRCDLHPWMNAWVRVFNHPYFALTGADGSFALPPLPPGTYRIKAWHEMLGVREKTVEIRAGRAAIVNLTFDAR